jgi:pre ATP-grasp domain-containing protein
MSRGRPPGSPMPESRRLYVHCVRGLPSHRARGAVPGLEEYPERALVMARRGDLVCVSAPVDGDHLAFLNELGVGPAPGDLLVPCGGHGQSAGLTLAGRLRGDRRLLERIAAAVPPGGSLQLHPYAATPEISALATGLEAAGVAHVRVVAGSPEAAASADLKHVVRSKAIELGVPVAEGEVVELAYAGGRRRRDLEPVRAAIMRQLRRTGRVIVRGSAGAGGSSTFVAGRGADDAGSVIRRLGGRADNRVYLVEVMVELTVSPNLRLTLGRDGRVTRVTATDQRWGPPLVHAGNVYPSAARLLAPMEEWARAMAGWLGSEGYAGDVGFDFVEHRDASGAPAAFLAEVNPRVNGANYPLALCERLNAVRGEMHRAPVDAFASGPLRTHARSFPELREALGDLLFSHDAGRGIVPYSTGSLARGCCAAAALAPTRLEALALHAEAQSALEAPTVARC